MPDPQYAALWGSIVVGEALKDCLLRSVAPALRLQESLPFEITALRGTTLSDGLLGTGKATLARGLAHQAVPSTQRKTVKLIQVNPHGLMSAEPGQTCKPVPVGTGSIVPTLHRGAREGSGRTRGAHDAKRFAVPDGLLANQFRSSRAVLNSRWPAPTSCQVAPVVDEARLHYV